MLYVHGGAYFFGSVDEHRYQMQRHARKLRARVFAPRYRLAPQFPFPCGLVDCLAAYLHLLTIHAPEEIILAGDSAGGGMVVALLVILRDQSIPLPAGAVLISPWVDLTHSFPSVAEGGSLDYIPVHGFMHRPSVDWPPEPRDSGLSIEIDGNTVHLKEQMQLYATNQLVFHPLVSPVLQPSLGGLPPLLVLTGGGEVLRDEQIYLAHKAADPLAFRLASHDSDSDDQILNKYSSTPVQLQVWEDLCHVAPTLSFTRPAKYMYRSIAQFGAWALARAQRRPIEITDDDDVSIISIDSADMVEPSGPDHKNSEVPQSAGIYVNGKTSHVGRAGDPIPHFVNSMVRQQVDRHGNISPLQPASDLPALQMPASDVGKLKEKPVRRWLEAKKQWDARYSSQQQRVAKRRRKDAAEGGYIPCPGENPPPSALAGRRMKGREEVERKTKRSWGMSLWSLWGSKHDESTMKREAEVLESEEAEKEAEAEAEAESKAQPETLPESQPTAASAPIPDHPAIISPDTPLPPTPSSLQPLPLPSPLSPLPVPTIPNIPPSSPTRPSSRPISRPRTKSRTKSTSSASISLSFRSPVSRSGHKRQASLAAGQSQSQGQGQGTGVLTPTSPRLRRTTVADLGQVDREQLERLRAGAVGGKWNGEGNGEGNGEVLTPVVPLSPGMVVPPLSPLSLEGDEGRLGAGS